MRDSAEDEIDANLIGLSVRGIAPTAIDGSYQAARIVEPPQGRLRAARVAESGSIGDRSSQGQVTIVPFEDLLLKHQACAANPDPRAAFLRVTASWYQEVDISPSFCDTILAEGGFIVLALSGVDQAPIGCAALHKRAGEEGDVDAPESAAPTCTSWELGELGVRADFQNRGVGRLLGEALLRQFAEAAAEGETLHLRIPAALEATRPFFRKLGFEEVSAPEGDHVERSERRMEYHGKWAPRAA